MQIKPFFEYQKAIWSGAFSNFKKKNLFSEILKILFIEVPVSYLASIYFFKDNEPILIAFLTIGFLIILNIIFFIGYLVFEPTNIFLENSEKIGKLSPEDPLEIKILPPYRIKQNTVWVGFEIYNRSLQTVHFTLNIKIDQMEKTESLDPLLEHGTRDIYTPIELSGETDYPYYFVCAGIGNDWENAVLNTKKDIYRRIMPGTYDFVLLINGSYPITNKAILHKEEFFLIYNGNDDLRLERKT